MSLSAEQLEKRRHGIGGSEISAILGLHPFMGALDVWLAKTEGFQKEATDDMRRGSFLEQGIANWYADREEAIIELGMTVVHATRPRTMCTPDFFAKKDGNERLLSIKAPRRGGDDWGETGGRVVPEYAALQLQQEDAVCRSNGLVLDPVSHLAALVDGDLRIYAVERDEELQGWLLDFAETWWKRHVDGNEPPPLDGSDGAKAWLRRRFPKNTQPARAATLEEEALVLALKAAETQRDVTLLRYTAARQEVEQAIGAAGGLNAACGRVTWRADKNGKRSFKTNWSPPQ